MHKKNKPLILIVGFGSIGQRHYRNIKKIFKNNVQFLILRKKSITPLLTKDNKIKKNQKLNDKFAKVIHNLNVINLQKTKIHSAFICTPSSKHVDIAVKLISNDINTFIEKPLSNNLRKLNHLNNLLKKSNSINMIGFQMRFNPIIKFLKKGKNFSDKIGNINFIQIDHGEDVRKFHPWENYKDSYTSKKNLGGGVTLSQIHEFDYFNFLFNKFKIVKSRSIISKISNLSINVDDTSSHLFLLSRKNRSIICNINLNFYENPKNRIIKFIGNSGKLTADLNNGEVKIYTKKKCFKRKFYFERNDLYIDELKYYFNCIKQKKKLHSLDINYAIKNLKFTLKLFN